MQARQRSPARHSPETHEPGDARGIAGLSGCSGATVVTGSSGAAGASGRVAQAAWTSIRRGFFSAVFGSRSSRTPSFMRAVTAAASMSSESRNSR